MTDDSSWSGVPVSKGGATSHGMGASELRRAQSILLWLLGVEVVVLLVTGIALFFIYRPSMSQAWSDVVAETYGWELRVSFAVRAVHRLVSSLAVFTAIALGVVLALTPVGGRRWTGRALAGGIALSTLLASFTGFLLPWDQLALRAVKVGSTMRGFTPLFRSEVRFVLIGGVEVGRGTILGWLFVHAVVLGPLLLALVVLAWLRHRGEPAPR